MEVAPKFYAAMSDPVRGQPERYAVRMTDSAQEVLQITLSGYRVGAETSPREYAERIAQMLNGEAA